MKAKRGRRERDAETNKPNVIEIEMREGTLRQVDYLLLLCWKTIQFNSTVPNVAH